MTKLLENLNIDQLIVALNETLFMTFTSLILSVVFGLIIGILLYCTQSGGLYKNKVVNVISDFIINVLRAIPFIILLFILIPFTKMMVGTMLGAKAAIPSLAFAATPFFARLAVIAFTEVDKGTIEASKAMGASKIEIIIKVLIPESLPALVSGVCVTGISLISYTAMSGVIGAGGLGNLAYLYGFVRRNDVVLYSATALVVIIVFIIQGIGDYIVKRIDKR